MAIGCYRYTAVPAPQPGMEVRAQLRTEAAVRRSEGMESPIVRYEGVVVDVTPEAFSIDVLIARSSSAFQDVTIRDTVRLQTAEVQSVAQRTISPFRTALFVVGAGAAAFGIVKGIDQVVGGTGDDDDDGRNPPAMRIPVFSWTSSRLLRILGGHR
jgi:hypothetical protein